MAISLYRRLGTYPAVDLVFELNLVRCVCAGATAPPKNPCRQHVDRLALLLQSSCRRSLFGHSHRPVCA